MTVSLLTADEAAKKYNVRKARLLEWCKLGQIDAVAGKPVLIYENDRLEMSVNVYHDRAPYGHISVADCAKRIGLTNSRISGLVKDGKLDAIRLLGRMFIADNRKIDYVAETKRCRRITKKQDDFFEVDPKTDAANEQLNALMAVFRDV